MDYKKTIMRVKDFYKRTQYLVYYIKKLDWPRYRKFVAYAKEQTLWSSLRLQHDMLKCIYNYNIGIMDYFIFRYFEKQSSERNKWVGTGYKYEYDLIMNPKNKRHLLENKIDFYETYKPFVMHATCTIRDIQSKNNKAKTVLQNPTGKIVVKDSLGQCGWNVEILNSGNFSEESLTRYMKSKGYNLAEEFIVQHSDLSSLSASGVNTIRIITQLNKNDEVDILGARLRVSVNNYVDNLASGNLAASVDILTGIVNGPGIFSDITKSNLTVHPVSGTNITGFQIPYWIDCINLVKKAALYRPENRSIGWDVVVTEKGPELLEGNHNWCKILWQLPVNKGMKNILDQYRNDLP